MMLKGCKGCKIGISNFVGCDALKCKVFEPFNDDFVQKLM